MEQFIQQIIKNLESNGFPQKKVSLPTEKMYEVADNKGVSLNTVLDELSKSHQIMADIGDDKIVFTAKLSEDVISDDPFAGMDQAQMMQKAQEMMAQMDPEQLKQMQETFMNMSETEKADIMQKGKDLGIG